MNENDTVTIRKLYDAPMNIGGMNDDEEQDYVLRLEEAIHERIIMYNSLIKRHEYIVYKYEKLLANEVPESYEWYLAQR